MNQFKFYLAYENKRNSHHEDLFIALIKRAFGCKEVVLVGHHFVCDYDNDLKTLNEIPSADTLIFDHDVMTAVFGNDAVLIMSAAATKPVPERDDFLRSQYELLFGPLPVSNTPEWWSMPAPKGTGPDTATDA